MGSPALRAEIMDSPALRAEEKKHMKHMEDMIRKTYLQFDPGEGAGGAGGAGTGAAGGPGEGQTGGAEALQQRRRSKGEDLSGVV